MDLHLAADEQFEKLIGDRIAPPGSSRIVYKYVGRDDLVIKVSISSNVANWTEFLIYSALNELDGAAIFGAIHAVSASGKYLVMERLDDLLSADLPKRPNYHAWMTDRKPSACGKTADGVVKFRDYALVNVGSLLANSVRTPPPSPEDIAEMDRLIKIMNPK